MGGEHDTKPAAATPAAPAGNLVDTKWYVDYNKLAGSYTRAPSRMAEDQLVVEQLKIVPDADGTQILRGGNAAGSGQVLLGVASIPASTGQVSAAVKYSKHSAFQLDVTLEGDTKGKKPTLTPAERKDLAAAKAEMLQQLDPMLQERGDYAAIQAELEAAYADRFPDKHLVVKVLPTGAKNSGTSTFTAAAAPYDASHTTKFLVTIDPHQQQDRSTTYTKTTADDHAHGTHDNQSTTATNDVTTQNATTVIDQNVKKFEHAFHDNVQTTFGEIVTNALNLNEIHESDVTRSVDWKLGVGPKPEKKEEPKDAKPDSPSFVKRVLGHLAAPFKYVASKASKLFKFGSAVLELGGDLWDAVSGRAWFTRDSNDGSVTKNGGGGSFGNTKTAEERTVSSIGQDFVDAVTTTHSDELRTEIATRLSLAQTTSSGGDVNDKKSTITSVSGSSTTHDVGELAVSVTAKGG
jgi:hypothetical protein